MKKLRAFALPLGALFLQGCWLPDSSLADKCFEDFSYQVHSDELWQRYIELAAPHLLEEEGEGKVQVITSGNFRVVTGRSYACDPRLHEEDPSKANTKGCEYGKLARGLNTFTALITLEGQGDEIDQPQRVVEPIITFRTWGLPRRARPVFMLDCISEFEDEFVTMAYRDWERKKERRKQSEKPVEPD